MTAVTIRDVMADPALFGDTFGGDSFAAWRALMAGFYGLPLDDDEAETWRTLTGRAETATEAHDELWLVIGRRGGKSRVAAALAVYEACFRDHRSRLAPGEWATVVLIAADRPQARTLLRYVRGMFEHPMLRPLVARETAEGLELVNRCAIEIGTATFRGLRGYTLAAAILDEIAFWHGEGANPDTEIIAAIRPALATLGGPLVAISSPYARRGVLWDAYRRRYGKPGRVLVAQAPSRTMNPTLPERVVEDALADDPARAAAEYLAQFRSDVEQFITLEAVTGAQRPKPLELPWRSGVRYAAFVDPSGGGADEFTIAIAHEEDGRVIIDAVRGRKGSPAAIVADFADFLRAYGVSAVRGDRYAGEWPRVEFRKFGVEFTDAPGSRSDLYAAFASALASDRVELPPCPVLERQLVALERRTGRGGRDVIDHAPGAHDDRANAAAGVVAMLATEAAREPWCETGFVMGLF